MPSIEVLPYTGTAPLYMDWLARTDPNNLYPFCAVLPGGGIFVAYVLITLVAARVLRWSAGTTLLALAASIPPLVTVWFERWASRTGRLPARDAVPTA